MDRYRVFKAPVGAVYAAACSWVGGVDALLTALLLFMAFDVATGVTVAALNKSLSSRELVAGVCRKCLELALVGAANAVDSLLTGGSPLRTAVILFYLAGEGLSLVENAGALGLPVPKKLKSVLRKRRSDE